MTNQINAGTKPTVSDRSDVYVCVRGGNKDIKRNDVRTCNLKHLSLSQAKARASVGEGSRYRDQICPQDNCCDASIWVD